MFVLSSAPARCHPMPSPHSQPREIHRVGQPFAGRVNASGALSTWPSWASAAPPMRRIRSGRPDSGIPEALATRSSFPPAGRKRSKDLTASDRVLLGYHPIHRCQPETPGPMGWCHRIARRVIATNGEPCPESRVRPTD